MSDRYEENTDVKIVDGIGYGFCKSEEGMDMVVSPTYDTVIETYKGRDIRMYVGGRYIYEHVFYSGMFCPASYTNWTENINVIITVSGKNKPAYEYRFARIYPESKRTWISRGGIFSFILSYWKDVEDRTPDWISSDHTKKQVLRAIVKFKNDIDEEEAKKEKQELQHNIKINIERTAAEKLVMRVKQP